MRHNVLLIAVVLILACVLSSVSADVPTSITVQGRLTDDTGNPVPSGKKYFTFKIFTSEVGGSEVWPDGPGEEQQIITDAEGLWTAVVGAEIPIPARYFSDTTRWLEIAVDDGDNPPVTFPRVRLTSGPYVFYSSMSQHADTADVLAGGGGAYLPLTGGTMTGDITNTGDPAITMGKANFGSGNTNIGGWSFVAGIDNAASGYGSAIGGGRNNAISSSYGTVSGGESGEVNGNYGTIGGGLNNQAAGNFSTISGGRHGAALGIYSVVAGGGGASSSDSNAAVADYSTVGGGRRSHALGVMSTVSGGWENTASDSFASIAGGVSGQADGQGSVIGGGGHNRTNGDYCIVAGGGGRNPGDSNYAIGGHSAVLGGSGNGAERFWSVVGGGRGNTAAESWSTVCGGTGNSTEGDYAAVVGGAGNKAAGQVAFIGGGSFGRAWGPFSVVGGGGGNELADSNSANGIYCTVAGGRGNAASGIAATVPGGSFNTAAGDYSFAAGYGAKARHYGSFVWADSSDSDFETRRDGQFLIRASGGVGIGTDSTDLATLTVHANSIGSGELVRLYTGGLLPGAVEMSIQTNPDIEFGYLYIECKHGTNSEFSVSRGGNVTADGIISGGGADFAEIVPVSNGAGQVEPGDVMMIDPANPASLMRSQSARSTLVAGIYSTAPGFLASKHDWDRLAAEHGIELHTKQGAEPESSSVLEAAAALGEIPLAVVGIVPCKVSTENGPINAGDLLVTSATPGHAMRDDNPRAGTILGKALGTLASGTGTIDVLVTLQ